MDGVCRGYSQRASDSPVQIGGFGSKRNHFRDGNFQFRFYLLNSFLVGTASISAREYLAESQGGSNILMIPPLHSRPERMHSFSNMGIFFQLGDEQHRVPIDA